MAVAQSPDVEPSVALAPDAARRWWPDLLAVGAIVVGLVILWTQFGGLSPQAEFVDWTYPPRHGTELAHRLWEVFSFDHVYHTRTLSLGWAIASGHACGSSVGCLNAFAFVPVVVAALGLFAAGRVLGLPASGALTVVAVLLASEPTFDVMVWQATIHDRMANAATWITVIVFFLAARTARRTWTSVVPWTLGLSVVGLAAMHTKESAWPVLALAATAPLLLASGRRQRITTTLVFALPVALMLADAITQYLVASEDPHVTSGDVGSNLRVLTDYVVPGGLAVAAVVLAMALGAAAYVARRHLIDDRRGPDTQRAPVPAPARHGGRGFRLPTGTSLAIACGLVVIALVVVQAINLAGLLDPNQVLTAGFARGLVLGYVLAVAAVSAWALFAPTQRLAVGVYACAGFGALILLGTLSLGGEVWSLVVAALSLTACWQVGWWMLRALRQPALAEVAPVSWVAGTPVIGFVLLAFGRVSWLRWWDLGVPVLVIGALGAYRLVRRLRAGPARRAWGAVRSSRPAVAVVAIGMLTLGLASVWTSAPEIMFDALYGKAWLPMEWARSGAILPLVTHPVLNNAGFTQLLAVPGQLVHAAAVGRYMEWLATPALVASVWWAGRRSPWAPLAAAAIVVTPHVFWQTTTADDDTMLALGAVGLAIAVLRLTPQDAPRDFLSGVTVGVLAGACIDLKIHLLVLAAGLALGWWIWTRRFALRALAGVVVGAAVAVLPPLIMRWIDTGNPLLPSWNNIFHSPYWPPVNEQFNFPFLHDPGPLGPISVIVRSFTDPVALQEAAPIGAFGVLIGAVVVALLLGWCKADDGRRRSIVLWFGLLLAFLAWYDEFRYLRYLLPVGHGRAHRAPAHRPLAAAGPPHATRRGGAGRRAWPPCCGRRPSRSSGTFRARTSRSRSRSASEVTAVTRRRRCRSATGSPPTTAWPRPGRWPPLTRMNAPG